MEDTGKSTLEGMPERRKRRGTWPWFVLNVLLFPAPAHFTLLRVRDYSFSKVLRHLGVTLLLVLVLLTAGFFQLLFSGVGKWWMLLPAASGAVLLYTQRHLRGEFHAASLSRLTGSRAGLLLSLVALFAVIGVLPSLELIELDQKRLEMIRLWMTPIPFWQEMLILLLGLFFLMANYAVNTEEPVSIDRAVILYACFVVIVNQALLLFVLTFGWLKFQGGFVSRLLIVLLAAILALDYWDARTLGQYVRRFFFLTCTKIAYAAVFWLCLAGLPQKAASTYLTGAYEQVKEPPAALSGRYLVVTDRDRFQSAHSACRKLRALFTKALLASDDGQLRRIAGLVETGQDAAFNESAHVCCMARSIGEGEVVPTTMDFGLVPMFRPIQTEWDVMITAMLFQGTIAESDLERYIAGFKAMLPKASGGTMPGIDTPYQARYASLATGTRADFVPPRFEIIEALTDAGFCPVVSLRFAGTTYWTALLQLDRQIGMAWLRMENLPETDRAIQSLFDAGKAKAERKEVLSRSLVPVPIDYLKRALDHSPGPAVVFSREGLAAAMPDRFAETDLFEMDRAVAFTAADPSRLRAHGFSSDTTGPFSDYAAYLAGVARIKAILSPATYDPVLFDPPRGPVEFSHGVSRLKEVDRIVWQLSPLRDCDRFDIADLMVEHQHLHAAPDLFFELVKEKPFSSDAIACSDAFAIGRELFLMGRHEEGRRYLKISFLRHPFSTEYELWYRIAEEKLGKAGKRFYSPPTHEADLYLYYRTVSDIRSGDKAAALRRLEQAVENDSHNSLARHLLSRYFDRPVDERYFFPAPEGL